jgi:hypothetical protein
VVASKETQLKSSRLLQVAPETWGEEDVLRECGLISYPESHVEILREIFPALLTIYLEENLSVDRRYCGSRIKGQLRATVQDLRFTARFLAIVARESISETRETDRQLGCFADRLAVQVEKLADRLEEKIVPQRRRKTHSPDDPT